MLALAYFFFDFSIPTKQTYESALRSIILQLSSQSSVAWQILVESAQYFEGHRQREETAWNVSASLLLKILARFLLAYNQVYIVLDALDETIDQEDVLAFILDLQKGKDRKLNIVVTSRQERNIQLALENAATDVVAVTAEAVEEDIRQHIQKRLSQDRRLQKWPESLRMDIEVSLTKDAKGMQVAPTIPSVR